MEKKKWFKPAIEGGAGACACACCGGASELLNIETKLYYGFGGWVVNKNGEQFFCENTDVDFDECKDVVHVEELIGEDSENEYLAIFDSPLRSAVYQRHAKNNWVLIEKGEWFA